MQTINAATGTSRRPIQVESATYSLAEVCRLLGIGYTSGREHVLRGEFPVAPIRIGRQFRFPKASVHQVLGIDEGGDR